MNLEERAGFKPFPNSLTPAIRNSEFIHSEFIIQNWFHAQAH